MKIGIAIRAARISKGITANELTKKAKLPRGYISRIECGDFEPKVQTFRRIAAAMGVESYKILKFAEKEDATRLVISSDSTVNHPQPMP